MTQGMSDRRLTRRHADSDEHEIVSTRVRPGHRAKLIDVSAGGALIETTHRLLPGYSIELHVETDRIAPTCAAVSCAARSCSFVQAGSVIEARLDSIVICRGCSMTATTHATDRCGPACPLGQRLPTR
jgi:hypothetical protein